MKKIFLLLLINCFVNLLNAQTTNAVDSLPLPAYKRLPDIPAFTITLVSDSSVFAKENLKKKTQTLIILFSPDCGHCEHATKQILAKIDSFKNTQIIMVSNLSYDLVRKFYDKYKIADYPTIKVGVDKNYFLGSFYKLTSFPTIFLYNKKGKFKATFAANNTISNIIAIL